MSPKSYLGINSGSNNGMWKGTEAKYIAIHLWVNKNWNKLKVCAICGTDKNIDLANITGIYERAFINWEYLCRKHHMQSDGRLENLTSYRGNYAMS